MANKEKPEVKQSTPKTQPTQQKSFLKLFLPSLLILCIAIFVVLAFEPSILSSWSVLNLFKRELSTKSEMAADNESWKNAKNIYEFQAKDIDGNLVDMAKYKNRVLLIVK